MLHELKVKTLEGGDLTVEVMPTNTIDELKAMFDEKKHCEDPIECEKCITIGSFAFSKLTKNHPKRTAALQPGWTWHDLVFALAPLRARNPRAKPINRNQTTTTWILSRVFLATRRITRNSRKQTKFDLEPIGRP